MASSGKKKSKSKGVTLSLTSFLSNEANPDTGSAPTSRGGGSSNGRGGSTYTPVKSWADEVDDEDDFPPKPSIDRSQLPTAPRSARGPDIDISAVPSSRPFKAYIGNLPYDVTPSDIEHFFCKLKVIDVSLPQEQGRRKGFGYAEFEDRQSLIDALAMTDEMMGNRKIRIDLAQTQDRERDGFRGRRDEADDRTSGDWRKKDDRPSSFSNRNDDRGSFDRRDDGPDRDGPWTSDRGGDRYSSRGGDFGSRGGSQYNDRSSDRYGDRSGDRYGDRDRGGFRDRDGGRSFGSGYNDRGGSGYNDRGGSGYNDRGGSAGRYEPPRDRAYDRGYDRDRRDVRGAPPRDDFKEPEDNVPKERPKLNLQKRSKPIEEDVKSAERSASIFGNAKPVDTAAREREIEDRLRRQRESEQRQAEEEKENRERITSSTSQRSRKESSGSQDGGLSRRERKLSSSSSGKVAPPPGSGSARVRRDSALSDEEDVFHQEHTNKATSPPVKVKDDKVLVPAPIPRENIWEKRKTSDGSKSSEVHKEVDEPKDSSKDRRRSHEDKELLPPKSKEYVPAGPPKENAWDKRRNEKKPDTQSGTNVPAAGRGDVMGRGRGSDRGRAGSTGGRGRGRDHKYDKPLPKSIEEMPKYEENKSKDFSDSNKFSFLLDEEENGHVLDE